MAMISRLVAMSSGSSLTKRSGGFFRMSHIYLKVPGSNDRFELWSIRRCIFYRFKLSFVKAIAFSTAERYAPIACDSRSVEAMIGRPALMMLRDERKRTAERYPF
jgi:hypothetical protein